jgi:hypothetical protein
MAQGSRRSPQYWLTKVGMASQPGGLGAAQPPPQKLLLWSVLAAGCPLGVTSTLHSYGIRKGLHSSWSTPLLACFNNRESFTAFGGAVFSASMGVFCAHRAQKTPIEAKTKYLLRKSERCKLRSCS